MTPADLERFRRICGLLGSDQVGERAAAAAKATELLRAAGLSWADVRLPEEVPAFLRKAAPEAAGGPAEPDMMQAARQARDHLAAQQRAAKRARWEQSADQPDADGFYGARKV